MLSRFPRLVWFNQRSLLLAWMVLGIAVVFGNQLCSTIWALSNPMPHHWDNAMYLNQAYGDYYAYQFGGPTHHKPGLTGVWDSMINSDPWIPPAYRLVSAPFIFTGIQMLPLLRAISLITFWVSLYIIYRAGMVVMDGPAWRVAGMIAAMLLAMYSEIGWSIRVYGTEHTLYLATALLLYCLGRATRDSGRSHLTWIGLGFALGLGILSKLSFALLAGPAMVGVVVLMALRRLPGLCWWKLIAASGIALLMAWPYYHLHLMEAFHYGQDMTQFQRHSLHKNGLALLSAWARLHVHEGMGPQAAAIAGILILVFLVTISVKRMGRRLRPTPAEMPAPTTQSAAVGSMIFIALLMGIPLLMFQLLFSQSDNVRHMTPAYFPLTLAITLAAAWGGALISWWSWAVLLACAVPAWQQFQREAVPMSHWVDDVWDWEPLYKIAQDHQIQFPMIGHVGNTSLYCDPAITYPWARRGGWANSLWLWRPEDGAFHLQRIQAKLIDRNMLITAPDLKPPAGTGMLADPVELDNAHNAEFAAAIQHDPAWQLAGRFSIGVVNRGEIWVFVRRK